MEEQEEKNLPLYDFMDMYAYITYKAYDNNFVGFCYRDYSNIKIDSGWRFQYGDEDQNYLDNPDNSHTMYIKELLEWKPELKSIINSKHKSEFEWDDIKEEFIEI